MDWKPIERMCSDEHIPELFRHPWPREDKCPPRMTDQELLKGLLDLFNTTTGENDD